MDFNLKFWCRYWSCSTPSLWLPHGTQSRSGGVTDVSTGSDGAVIKVLQAHIDVAAGNACNVVFTICFAVEVTLKIIGYGVEEYFQDNWNCFDFVLVST